MHPILLVVLVPKIAAAKSNRDLPQISKMTLAVWLQRNTQDSSNTLIPEVEQCNYASVTPQ